MRPESTRWTRVVLLGALVLATLSVDPNPRGPLAIAADLWLAGHDDEAERWQQRAVGALRELHVDPASLSLSTDFSMGANVEERQRLEVALDRLAKDDRAKVLYRALWLARCGNLESAHAALAAREQDRSIPRWRVLLHALRPKDHR